MRGLAATPDYLAFSMRSGDESVIYLFNRHTWAITKLGSFRGTVGDMAYHQGVLTAYYNDDDGFIENRFAAGFKMRFTKRLSGSLYYLRVSTKDKASHWKDVNAVGLALKWGL